MSVRREPTIWLEEMPDLIVDDPGLKVTAHMGSSIGVYRFSRGLARAYANKILFLLDEEQVIRPGTVVQGWKDNVVPFGKSSEGH